MEQYKIEATLVPSTKKDMFQYRVKLFTAYTTVENGLRHGVTKEVHKNVKVIWEGDYWTGSGWYKKSGDRYADKQAIARIISGNSQGLRHRIELPSAKHVIYSLLMDYQVIDYKNFEQWAYETGFDCDSRKAEQIYKDSLKTALELRQTLGEDEIRRLQELLRDF